MTRYNFILKSIFACTMVVCTSLHPQQEEVALEPQQKEQQLSTNHYISHLITGFGAHLAMGTSALAGLFAGLAVEKTGIGDWTSYQMGLTPKEFKCESRTILFGMYAVPLTLCTLAGLYIMYKTPQWTDKYLLKEKKDRTLKQNVIVLLNRSLLPYPVGVLTGEYFTH